MNGKFLAPAVLLAGLLGLAVAPVGAAPSRTFVASSGADANAALGCSLAAPCRTFAAAVGAVGAGGEVVALDTGGFGALTITQSVTITGPAGIYAGVISPNPGNAVTINAPGASVRLRGLTLDSTQPWVALCSTCAPTTGIAVNILAAANVSVENCVIAGFPYMGVQALPAPSTQTTPLLLNVLNSVFIGDGTYAAIYLQPGNQANGGTVIASVRGSSFNGFGNYLSSGNEAILVADGASLNVDSCETFGYWLGALVYTTTTTGRAYLLGFNSEWNNAYNNVVLFGTAGTMIADLRANSLSGTSTAYPSIYGSVPADAASIAAGSAGAHVNLYANTISNNSNGILQSGAAVVSSFGNNQFSSNGVDVVGTLNGIASK